MCLRSVWKVSILTSLLIKMPSYLFSINNLKYFLPKILYIYIYNGLRQLRTSVLWYNTCSSIKYIQTVSTCRFIDISQSNSGFCYALGTNFMNAFLLDGSKHSTVEAVRRHGRPEPWLDTMHNTKNSFCGSRTNWNRHIKCQHFLYLGKTLLDALSFFEYFAKCQQRGDLLNG